MGELPLQQWMQPCCDIAVAAGTEILKIYNTEFEVDQKSDDSPLTQADLSAHQVIKEKLAQLTPDIPQLSEEGQALSFEERSSWETYWLIDPLDGTKEFVKRNGEFTVNIALIHKHEPVLGVVYVPAKDTLYYGARNFGAFRKEGTADAQAISCRQLPETPVMVASRSHVTEELQQFLDNVGDHDVISMGSSLKFCLVAEGSADLYPRIGLTCEWDTGAAQAVVEAAGGRVTDTNMQPLRYNTKDALLNPYFFVIGDNDKDWSQYLAK